MLDYLNHYELVAIGIHHDILDETIYRSWMQSHVVMEWNAAAGFVQNERWRIAVDGTDMEYHPAIFANLQRAVTRWSPQAIRLTAAYAPKPSVPVGIISPGDVALPDTRPVDLLM